MLISCIIPTRNRPEFVADAVRSVLQQSHANFELIIINDGDTPVPAFEDVTRPRSSQWSKGCCACA